MGYWFYPIADGETSVGGYYLQRIDKNEKVTDFIPTEKGRVLRVLSIKGPSARDGELTFAIGQKSAIISSSEGSWQGLVEPVLLTIGQYWRFHSMERELFKLSEQVRTDKIFASAPGIIGLFKENELVARDRSVRDFTADWIYFSGLLTDPGSFCSSEKSVDAYLAVSEKLDIEGWCERLDEMVSMVVGAYETITDKIFHYKLFLWGIILEVIIIFLIAKAYYK